MQQSCHGQQAGNVQCPSLENIKQYYKKAEIIKSKENYYDVCAVKDVVVSFNLPHFCVNSNLTVFGAEVSRVMSLCGERRGAGC